MISGSPFWQRAIVDFSQRRLFSSNRSHQASASARRSPGSSAVRLGMTNSGLKCAPRHSSRSRAPLRMVFASGNMSSRARVKTAFWFVQFPVSDSEHRRAAFLEFADLLAGPGQLVVASDHGGRPRHQFPQFGVQQIRILASCPAPDQPRVLLFVPPAFPLGQRRFGLLGGLVMTSGEQTLNRGARRSTH